MWIDSLVAQHATSVVFARLRPKKLQPASVLQDASSSPRQSFGKTQQGVAFVHIYDS